MQDTFKSDTDLDIALEKLCETLCQKGAIAESDKQKAVTLVKQALLDTFGKSTDVPQNLFTDPAKQQNLIIGLVTAPIKDQIPSLNFDLNLFFKAQLQPEESKKLFKAFLVGLNKLEPDPAKRRSDESIEKEADALLKKYAAEKTESKSLTPDNKEPGFDPIDEMWKVIFGYNRFGVPTQLTIDKGNIAGIVNTASAISVKGGSLGHSLGLGGDSTTDPYVFAMAQERMLDIGGLSAEALNSLKRSGIIHASPTLTPGTGTAGH